MATFQKINDKIEKTEVITKKVEYTYDSLVIQRENILDQKNRQIAFYDKELADIEELIAEADKLGLKSNGII